MGLRTIGQTFKGNGENLTECKFLMKKVGTPTGNAVVKLYTHTGTYGSNGVPTGAVLATSDNFDISTLTTSYTWATFTFSGGNIYELGFNTPYCLALEAEIGTTENHIVVGADSSSPSATGNYFYLVEPATWVDDSYYDLCFYVYNGAQHILSKSSGIVESNYLTISNSIATGGAAWYAGANSVDSGNNSGWIFETYGPVIGQKYALPPFKM